MRKLKINWRQVLPYISMVGVVATAVTSSKAGAKAQKRLEEANYVHHPSVAKDILEEGKIVWKDYIIPATVSSLTIASIFATKNITKKEMAALLTLSAASTKLLDNYKDAIREVVPEKYDEIVRTASRRRTSDDVQVANPPAIVQDGIGEIQIDRPHPGDDEELFYDELFDVWFRSSLANVKTAQYLVNKNFSLRGEVSLEEYYEFLGIENADDDFPYYGWGEEFRAGGCKWIDFNTIRSDKEDGEKFYILQYVFSPEYLYPFLPSNKIVQHQAKEKRRSTYYE